MTKTKYEYEWFLDYYILTIHPKAPQRKKEYKIPNEEILQAVFDDLAEYAPYELRKVEKYCRISV